LNSIRAKNVLITGAGRGIGKRLAIGFAKEGARVALLARSHGELEMARLEIEQAGGAAVSVRADVRDLDQVRVAIGRVLAEFGSLDVLIAAAGVQGPIGPLLETSPQAWRETVEIDLLGVVNACRAALPPMIEKRSGKIIVMSGGGWRP
jgi:3-oxoacyl-[acyl-carrier protein] reductase